MTSVASCETQLVALSKDVHFLKGAHATKLEALQSLVTSVEREEVEEGVLTLTGTALQHLLNVVSAESLQEIERVVSYGLKAVFEDQDLSFWMEVETKRGGQTVTPKLRAGAIEANVLESFGGGPASVCAFLLRLLVVHRLGLAKLILLDESFAMVSAQYVPAVARLLKELAGKLGFTLLLVTHQVEFLNWADRAYEASGSPGGVVFSEK